MNLGRGMGGGGLLRLETLHNKLSRKEHELTMIAGSPRLIYESFRKLGVPYSGVLIIRILQFRVLY